jgi:thiamine biosynthesis lipoprotein
MTGEMAAGEIAAIGTRVRVVVWPAGLLSCALATVGEELDRLDREASRFRTDSEISRLRAQNRDGASVFLLSPGLADLIGVALAAARFSEGLVDPTLGEAVAALGYDRDFSLVTGAGATDGSARPENDKSVMPLPGHPTGGWRRVELSGRLLRLPPGMALDLGATAKARGSDRAAAEAFAACGGMGGLLVSLGGDIATAGEPPAGGWPIAVSESPDGSDAPGLSRTQVVRLAAGSIATSSTLLRRWHHGGRTVHHIVDPRTGQPADGPWRTATVAAPTCAEANAASTAALVAGDGAGAWLERTGLPARLVGTDGACSHFGSWPAGDDEPIFLPPGLGAFGYRAVTRVGA